MQYDWSGEETRRIATMRRAMFMLSMGFSILALVWMLAAH